MAIRASTEWLPALQVMPVWATWPFRRWPWLALVAVDAPRQIAPLLVALGFIAFAVFSMRNIIFVAPALAFQISTAPPSPDQGLEPRSRSPGTAAIGAVVAWAAVLGPPRPRPSPPLAAITQSTTPRRQAGSPPTLGPLPISARSP